MDCRENQRVISKNFPLLPTISTFMKTAILLYTHSEKPSRDGLSGPRIVFTYDGDEPLPQAYVDQFPFFHDKLKDPEVVEHIVEVLCLVENEDNFNGDESFKFEKVEYNDYRIVYTFRNSEGDEHEVPLEIETVSVI